jgi:hypothetical protein
MRVSDPTLEIILGPIERTLQVGKRKFFKVKFDKR